MDHSETTVRSRQHGKVILSASIIILTLLALHVTPMQTMLGYACVFLGSSALYLWLARVALRTDIPANMLLGLLCAAIIVRASFLFSSPLGSDDAYRYLWDGKVQAAGIDPYRYTPGDPALDGLSSNLLPSAVNHPELKSVYFPVSQWVFFVSYKLAGEEVWGFKLFLLAAEVLTLLALWRLAPVVGYPRTGILLYGLCPLPILQFAYDAHLDGLGLPLLAFAVLLHLKQHRGPAMLLLGVSLAIKPVAVVLLPVLFLREKRWRDRLVVLIVPCIPFLLQFIPYCGFSNPFEGLLTFSRHWTFNGVAFELVDAILANNLPSRIVCAGCLALSLLLLAFSSISTMRSMYLSVLLLMVFSPVVHPWYVCWLMIFLPPVRSWSGIVFVATVSLTVFTVVGYRNSGAWVQHPLALAGEYLPVLVLCAMEVWKWQREGGNQTTSSA